MTKCKCNRQPHCPVPAAVDRRAAITRFGEIADRACPEVRRSPRAAARRRTSASFASEQRLFIRPQNRISSVESVIFHLKTISRSSPAFFFCEETGFQADAPFPGLLYFGERKQRSRLLLSHFLLPGPGNVRARHGSGPYRPARKEVSQREAPRCQASHSAPRPQPRPCAPEGSSR